MIHAFVRLVDRIAVVGAWSAGALILLMAGHILVEIFLRTFLASSTFVLDEFVGYAVAAATFLGAGYTLRHDSFIRVSLILHAVSEITGLRRFVEAICLFLGLVVTSGLLWYFAGSVLRHWERDRVSDTISQVPLWVPEGAVAVGIMILALTFLASLLEVFSGAPLLTERRSNKEDIGGTALDMRER